MNYWTKCSREMLRAGFSIGAKPFMLFLYLRTWETAPNGIRPSLRRIADDMGYVGKSAKSAICNHKTKLIKAGWIAEADGKIKILRTFTEHEHHSQKMGEHSRPMNNSFRKTELPIKEEKEQLEVEGREVRSDGLKVHGRSSQTSLPPDFSLSEKMKNYLIERHPGIDADHEFERFCNHHRAKGTKRQDWSSAWNYWVDLVDLFSPTSRGSVPNGVRASQSVASDAETFMSERLGV